MLSSGISRGQERGAVPGVPPSRHTSKGPGAQRQSPEGRGWAPHPSPLGPPALSTRRPSPSPGCLHPAPIPARSFPTMSSPSAKSHPSSVSPAAAPAAGPGRRGQSSRQGGEGEQGQEAAGQPWLNAPGQGAQAAPIFQTSCSYCRRVGGVRLPPGHPAHLIFPRISSCRAHAVSVPPTRCLFSPRSLQLPAQAIQEEPPEPVETQRQRRAQTHPLERAERHRGANRERKRFLQNSYINRVDFFFFLLLFVI